MHREMPGNVAGLPRHPCSCERDAETPAWPANAGFPGYPAPPSTPLRLRLLRVGDTSCTRRVHGACGRGWLGSRSEPAPNPGRSRSPGSSPAPPLPPGGLSGSLLTHILFTVPAFLKPEMQSLSVTNSWPLNPKGQATESLASDTRSRGHVWPESCSRHTLFCDPGTCTSSLQKVPFPTRSHTLRRLQSLPQGDAHTHT